MSKKNVLIAHPSPDLYGSDRMVMESVRALAATATVTVTLPSDGPLVDRLRALGATVLITPTPVLRKALLSPTGVLRVLGSALVNLPRMLALLRTLRPDAVYVNTITIPLWILAGRLARRRVVCHVHEAERSVSRLLRRLLVLPVRFATRVIANSLACRELLLEGGVRPDRITLVYNGVPLPQEVTPPRPTPAGRLVLPGRLSPRKGNDVAIRAVGELRARGHEVTLTLVGSIFPGYEWFEAKLRELAAGVEGVVFAGFQDPVAPYLQDADVVLVPSREEPFGNVAVEGMLAMRPVVASDVQGLSEIVRPGVTGLLVPPDDPVALADAVESLLTNWPQAVTMAGKAREEAEHRFSPDRYHREITAIILDDRIPD